MKIGDNIYFGRGPMEFVGHIVGMYGDFIIVLGVEAGCLYNKCYPVTISLTIQEPHSLLVLDSAEFARRTKNEPAFSTRDI